MMQTRRPLVFLSNLPLGRPHRRGSCNKPQQRSRRTMPVLSRCANECPACRTSVEKLFRSA
jgi:hypothetical protein